MKILKKIKGMDLFVDWCEENLKPLIIVIIAFVLTITAIVLAFKTIPIVFGELINIDDAVDIAGAFIFWGSIFSVLWIYLAEDMALGEEEIDSIWQRAGWYAEVVGLVGGLFAIEFWSISAFTADIVVDSLELMVKYFTALNGWLTSSFGGGVVLVLGLIMCLVVFVRFAFVEWDTTTGMVMKSVLFTIVMGIILGFGVKFSGEVYISFRSIVFLIQIILAALFAALVFGVRDLDGYYSYQPVKEFIEEVNEPEMNTETDNTDTKIEGDVLKESSSDSKLYGIGVLIVGIIILVILCYKGKIEGWSEIIASAIGCTELEGGDLVEINKSDSYKAGILFVSFFITIVISLFFKMLEGEKKRYIISANCTIYSLIAQATIVEFVSDKVVKQFETGLFANSPILNFPFPKAFNDWAIGIIEDKTNKIAMIFLTALAALMVILILAFGLIMVAIGIYCFIVFVTYVIVVCAVFTLVGVLIPEGCVLLSLAIIYILNSIVSGIGLKYCGDLYKLLDDQN